MNWLEFEGGAVLRQGRTGFFLVMTAHAVLAASSASAASLEVKGEGVRFVPEILDAQVGDIIAFRKMVPHAVAPVPGMWPEEADPAVSETGADYDYPIAAEGVYVFRCPHHWGARMTAAIVVGNPDGSAAIVARYLQKADADVALKPAKRLLKRLARRLTVRVSNPQTRWQ